jgi:hypothetical protein
MSAIRRLAIAALVLTLGACGVEDGISSRQDALGPLTCPAGQVPFNFAQFPQPWTAEWRAQNPDASIPDAVPLPVPNTVVVTYGRCNGQDSLAGAVGDICTGRTSCEFNFNQCAGPVQLGYRCSAGGGEQQLICANNTGAPCYFQMSCPQPAQSPTTADAGVRCVPESCHGATRRDPLLQCVPDTSRPVEFKKVGDISLSVFHDPAENSSAVFPPTRTHFVNVNASTPAREVVDVNPIGPFASAWGPTNSAWSTVSDSFYTLRPTSNFGAYKIYFSESLYDMRYLVRYARPDGDPDDGLHGALVLWAYDEWLPNASKTDPAVPIFRCQLHSIDLRKYGQGSSGGPYRGTTQYSMTLDERFLIPKDCEDDSGMALANEAAMARKLGFTDLVSFLNKYHRTRTVLAASYDLEGRAIVFDEATDDARKHTCGPNPVDFFYDSAAQAVDRYRYLSQRRVTYTDNFGTFTANQTPATPATIWFRPTNQTHLGVSALRPKKLVQRVRALGEARGYLRADVDWYLSGDRQKYWQTYGFTSDNDFYQAVLEGFLIPLGSNDQPLPEPTEGYPSLGTVRLTRSTAYGTTFSANYPVTKELREAFMKPGGFLETNKDGRKYLLRSCVRFGRSDSVTSWRSMQPTLPYSLDIPDADRCKTSATPMVIKLDHAVAPLDPLESDAFSEADPSAAGDGRMAQGFDNDLETECVTGSPECRTTVHNAVTGYGTFGGTIIEASLEATTSPDGGTSASASKNVEVLGFTVMKEDEEEDAVTVAGKPEVNFNIDPPWDELKTTLNSTFPGLRWESEVTAGQVGLGVGVGYTAPVRYGLLQGDVTFAFTVGFGAHAIFTYTYGGTSTPNCNGSNGDCQALYRLQASADLTKSIRDCYASGGRLAELSSDTEAGFVLGALGTSAAANGVWLGGQVADAYSPSTCLDTWDSSRCVLNHEELGRWLSNDEDFAQAHTFGSFTVDGTQIFRNGAVKTVPSGKPVSRGVLVAPSGGLSFPPLSESHPALCKYRNVATDTSHQLSATLEFTLGAGITIGFCTPKDSLGVCLEGSINFIGAALKPKLTYTHHLLTDALGRKGRQSDLTFSVDLEMVLLSGGLDLKVVFGKWFSFSYNLFTYNGLHIPGGGTLIEQEWPMYQELQ